MFEPPSGLGPVQTHYIAHETLSKNALSATLLYLAERGAITLGRTKSNIWTITGNWTAVDGVVTTASDVNALTASITVGGTTFDGADLANGLLNSSPINGVTYSCDGPTPVLDFQTGDPLVTVPVTLRPA